MIRDLRVGRDHTIVLAMKSVHLNPFHRMSLLSPGSSTSARSTSFSAGELFPCLRLRKPDFAGKENLEGRWLRALERDLSSSRRATEDRSCRIEEGRGGIMELLHEEALS